MHRQPRSRSGLPLTKYLARAYRRLGELHEQAGHTRDALQRYGDFVDMWKEAEPAMQTAVRAVRDRMRALQTRGG
ncbi:MAG: hypothetical protein K2R93_18460 [Gemmatimonadaceae bacterium]|nr:hypothetical protein [Gemmatimonadaceae bacterium]